MLRTPAASPLSFRLTTPPPTPTRSTGFVSPVHATFEGWKYPCATRHSGALLEPFLQASCAPAGSSGISTPRRNAASFSSCFVSPLKSGSLDGSVASRSLMRWSPFRSRQASWAKLARGVCDSPVLLQAATTTTTASEPRARIDVFIRVLTALGANASVAHVLGQHRKTIKNEQL